MSKPITLVVCTYNGEKYLPEVIESILNQDGFEENVEELVIVDNASSDNTKSIIMSYQNSHSNVRYIYEPIPGLSYARKHGAMVNSEWVAYLDDDNIIMQGWIKEAIKFITENPKIGVFNGASIAIIRHNASKEENVMLKAIYPYLACTHYSIEDYNRNVESGIKTPFGAGMVLRTNPLSKFLHEGWTQNVGRKGKELGSGEDGEIASAVLDHGYEYGYNYKMVLHHVIPDTRLQKKYVKKLLIGLNIGYYIYISGKKNYVYYRIKSFLKSLIIIISYPFRLVLCCDPVIKLKLRIEFNSRIRIIGFILRDIFFLKKSL